MTSWIEECPWTLDRWVDMVPDCLHPDTWIGPEKKWSRGLDLLAWNQIFSSHDIRICWLFFSNLLSRLYHYYWYWCNTGVELNTLYNKETTYTPQFLEMPWPRPWYFKTMLCNVRFLKKRNPSAVHIQGFGVQMLQNSCSIIRIFSFDTQFAKDNCVVWVLLFGHLGPNFYYEEYR